jgi:hypothetical protein
MRSTSANLLSSGLGHTATIGGLIGFELVGGNVHDDPVDFYPKVPMAAGCVVAPCNLNTGRRILVAESQSKNSAGGLTRVFREAPQKRQIELSSGALEKGRGLRRVAM